MSRFTAFNDSGRFSVIQAILSLTSYKTFSFAIVYSILDCWRIRARVSYLDFHIPNPKSKIGNPKFSSPLPYRRALLGEGTRPFLGVLRTADQCGEIRFQTQAFFERQFN